MMIPNISFGKWKRKFVDDFKKRDFLPIKVLFFLIFGANVSLIPFLTLQARSLGITEEEVGIIYSFIPIASLIAPPLSGMLADRIGNFRILLSVLTAMAGLSGVLFLVVPPGRVTHTLPDTLPLEITCSPYGNSLKVAHPYHCEHDEDYNGFHVDILDCSITCLNAENATEQMLETFEDSNLTCQKSTNCNVDFSDKFSLNKDLNGSVDVYSSTEELENLNLTTTSKIAIIFDREYKGNDSSIRNIAYESEEFLCPILKKPSKLEEHCYTTCKAETTRKHMCRNEKSIQEFNPSLTFYSHLVIRLLKEFTLATSMPLLEGAAVTILKEHKGDFGFQRMYCNIGMMVMTPISGTLIDYFTNANGFEDFRPAMYMYCGLKLFAAFIILFLNLEFKKASTSVISDFSGLMLNPEIVFFLIATFLAGTCYGYIETFLFWLLEDLGADKQLMGITITIGSIFGIPLLMVSTFIMKKLGHVNTIVLGFMVYIVRLFGYTLISSPWWAMPFEALECFTVSLMVVSFVSYASVLATPGTVVTLQGMYGGLYNGVGRGAGSLIGGFLIENIGIFQTFRTIAAIGGVSGIAYWSINMCFFRNRHSSSVTDVERDGSMKKEPITCNTDMTLRGIKEKDKNDEGACESKLSNESKRIEAEKGTDNKAFEGDNLS